MKTLLHYPDGNLNRMQLLAAIPIISYFAYFFYYGIDAPQFDDFQTVVRSAITFDSAENRLRWLIAQYGEHRIAYVRLVAVLVEHLTGHINFVWMGLIGNTSLIGVAIILFKWFRKWRLERYFIPVPFILFQMNYHHNTFTAMMALQNLTIIFWALITFWWVSAGRGWRPWAGLLTAILAVYTSGNGLFVVITAILMLVLRRQWQQAAIWIVVGGGAVFAYFWGMESLAEGKLNYNLLYLTVHAPQLAGFTIFFAGSYFDLLPNVLMSSVSPNAPLYMSVALYVRLVLPFIAGLGLITGSLLLLSRWCLPQLPLKHVEGYRVIRWMTDRFTYRRKANLFLGAVLLFVLLTAGVVALGRIDVGLSQSFAIRYKIYAPLLLIVCYAAALVNIRQHNLRARLCYVLLPISLLIGINSYAQNLNQIQNNKRVAFSGLHNMAVNKSWAVYGSFYGNIDSMMQTAIDRNMYRIDSTATISFSSLTHDLDKPCPAITIQVNTTTSMVHLTIQQSPLELSLLTAGANEGAYFILYNTQHQYLFPAQVDRNLVGGYQSGFHCDIERTSRSLTPGCYKIAVMTSYQSHRQLYRTWHQLTIRA